MELSEISEPLLWKLLNEATVNSNANAYPSQTGIGSVSVPDAVIGETKKTIWWSFSRNDAPAIDRTFFYEYEQIELKNAGITLPDSSDQKAGRP